MVQRTTIAADAEDLAVLRAEAERQAISLAEYMRRVVAGEAAELRRARRPSVGVGRSGGGVAAASVEDEDAPAATAPRS